MTDWLMVIITAIYVVATIFICKANIRSAYATREQLTEQKRQFDETNRAYVTVTFEIIRSGLMVLHIKNYGKLIANNVRIKIPKSFIDNIPNNKDKKILEMLNNSVFQLGIEQSWYCCMGSHLDLDKLSSELLKIEILYNDSIRTYNEVTEIDLKQYLWAIIYDSSSEDIYQQMKMQTEYMKNINQGITTIATECKIVKVKEQNNG